MERLARVQRSAVGGWQLLGPRERFARVPRFGEQVTAVARVGWRLFGRSALVPRWVGSPPGGPTERSARVQRLAA